MTTRYISVADTAKLVRAALKEAFPKGADDQPHAWKPSYQYKKERLDRLEQLSD